VTTTPVLRAEDDASDDPAPPRRGWRPSIAEALVVTVVAAVLLRPYVESFTTLPAVETWATIFVSIAVQALPFLVFGVLISGAITAFVPPSFFNRVLPKRPAYAVPVAGAAGVLLPGCECGSVPVASGLLSRGVAPAAALTFLLSAPAINPIVLVATAVAFPGQPEVVLARFVASLAAATVVGLIWIKIGGPGGDRFLRMRSRPHDHETSSRWGTFAGTARHDFLHAGGFLVIGGALAATLNTAVPERIYTAVADDVVLGVLVLSLLAVLMSICSEADAFVAASLTEFSPTAKLAFLTIGPMVDLKLIALQTGTFGRDFALRFAPLTFVTALTSAVLVSAWLL
jgi:uncharacterized protein